MRTINIFILLCVFCLFCLPTLLAHNVGIGRLLSLPEKEKKQILPINQNNDQNGL
ncbi:hypothetical protein HMPREF6745_0704 [Prevotella sp. oral taxon 472 str. F0295]|nr:hypothetical protein [Prevotella sp. oral taxon 472]EEX53844.1 hypothetical protein HMPREF6745_0704 [Prevotella sp. oral taxon 472 str. F0295]